MSDKNRSVDALLSTVETQALDRMAGIEPEVQAPIERSQPEVVEVEHDDDYADASHTSESSPSEEAEASSEDAEAPSEKLEAPSKETVTDSPIDEYGNPIGKKKLYTEEEVQNIVRDRLKRGNHDANRQDVKEATEQFRPDPNSEQSWEEQLGSFIDHHLDGRDKKRETRAMEAQEREIQAEFEAKFTAGYAKYNDFDKVVSKVGKALTPTIMLATRSLENPAAFVYAACKFHPQEVERISQIRDPFQQATEVGRLEARMKKTTTTPKTQAKSGVPLKRVAGDMPEKGNARPNIDNLIHKHAVRKFRR